MLKKFINKEKILLLLFCMITSISVLFFCSKNSPYYPFNNWVDENAFFTVGRSWLKGILPYRDLFEQKGPLLYFIFMIAAFINSKSFIVIFMFEVISFTICLYYVSKIINLFLNKRYCYFILPLFASILVSSPFFVHGGSAEEFCLPMFMITCYSFLDYMINRNSNYKRLFINGLIAGCICMIKFTLIGFSFIYMFYIFCVLVYNKQYKKTIKSCLVFLLGMFLPIGIFCLYFKLNNGLFDFINIYVFFNKQYATSLSPRDRLESMLEIFNRMLSKNIIIFNLIDVGILYFLFSKKMLTKLSSKVFFFLFFLFEVITVYYGCKDFLYYFLIIMPFILFGLIGLFKEVIHLDNYKKFGKIILFIVVLLLSSYFCSTSNNLYYSKYSKEDLVQYKFANIIHKNKGKTLLNYGFIDGGFYMASEILPNTKYFMSLNGYVSGMEETLTRMINKKEFDFIVLRSYYAYDPLNDNIRNNYHLVSQEKEVMEEIEFTYSLYQKNDDNYLN